MSTLPNPLTGVTASNPLGWPGATGTNMPPSLSGAPSVPGAPGMGGMPTPPGVGSGGFGGGGWGNPGNFGDPGGGKESARNINLTNIETGQLRNQLIPLFAQMMKQYGGQAGDFFTQLMNLGSPYYKEQQRASFEQGTNEGQNAAALSKQRLNASGYGAAPSGLEAGMMGEEATGQSQNLSQMFLQNLFQNEQMQMAGAGGLSSLAQLFNPSSLMTNTSGVNPIISPTFFDNLQQTMNSIFGQGGATGGALAAKQIGGF